MHLYHGTSTKYLEKILDKGLLPRRLTRRKSNWDDEVKSKTDFIYMTSAYPVFFAMVAAEKDKADLAIIKVETQGLELFPDEDFIAYLLYNKDNRKNSLSSYNEDICPSSYKHMWQDSLKHNGTVCTKAISPERLIDHKIISLKNVDLILNIGGDSMPIPINYKFKGEFYEKCIDTLFSEGEEAVKSFIEEDFYSRFPNFHT